MRNYRAVLIFVLCSLTACDFSGLDGGVWNNPHRVESTDDGAEKTLYSVFTSRPKHLDPVRTYNKDEATFIDQIYEPPLEYHYLKRPYVLQPLTLTKMPEVLFLNKEGAVMTDEDALNQPPAYSQYVFQIEPGIQYQPHPAFAMEKESGASVYLWKTESEANEYQKIDDFLEVGSKELIADDYIYQYKRMADPALQMPIWDLVSHYVVGLKEAREELVQKKSTLNKDEWLDLRSINIDGVKKIDRYTFSVTLEGTYPQFKYWLAFHFFAPVPMEVDRFYHLPSMVEKQITLDFHPVGTGAYMMTKHDANSEIVLQKNPHYRAAKYPFEGEVEDKQNGLLDDAGKSLPLIDTVNFRLEKESIPIWTKFLQGYYDRSGISSDSFDQAVSVSVDGIGLSDEMIQKGIQLNTSIEPATYYLGFNMLDDVVGNSNIETQEKNRLLRQAIAIAFDEEEQISIFRNGRGEVAQSPLPPGVFGYQSGEAGINTGVFDWVDGAVKRKPLETAKALLVQAGYPQGRDAKTGKPLVLNWDTTTGGGGGSARQHWFIKQFKKLGIELNIRATDYNRFQDKMENGNAQIYFWGWFADYPDPENFLFLLYGSNSRVNSGGSGVNSSNYDNPEYNRLFDQMKTMQDSPERLQIIQNMLKIVQHDVPWASSFHPQSFVLSNSWMKNYKPHGISQVTLKYQNIDVSERQAKRQAWNQPVIWPLILMALVMLLVLLPGFRIYQQRQSRSAL